MKFGLYLAFGVFALGLASPAAAKGPCPPRESGTYPWAINGIMDGDLWAWVYLEIGKDKQPVRCLIGNNNIDDSDLRFFVCKAFMDQWQPADSTQVQPGTEVKRFFLMAGNKHANANQAARKKFFADHPDQRPQCYPEG